MAAIWAKNSFTYIWLNIMMMLLKNGQNHPKQHYHNIGPQNQTGKVCPKLGRSGK
jgi:hypothetical protein